MRDTEGEKICPGLYALSGRYSLCLGSNPNKTEFYLVSLEKEDLIATDIKGDSFIIRDHGYHDRSRNPRKFSEIDCIDLVSVGQQRYETLKSVLTDSQERTSKLLEFLDQNKSNLS